MKILKRKTYISFLYFDCFVERAVAQLGRASEPATNWLVETL